LLKLLNQVKTWIIVKINISEGWRIERSTGRASEGCRKLQRDALHRALKSLLERQEHQNRENQKKLRQLEMERDRALSSSPKRLGYDKEVASLRNEINVLRRRAEEAIEQKWQCEKGLSG
jgi:hypothetical protein